MGLSEPLLKGVLRAACSAAWLAISSALWAQSPNFDNPSAAAGILHPGYHHAVAVGDYNGDGWDDIYVGTTNGANALYRNNRDMTFTEVGVLAGVADAGRTYAAVWADFDNDGDLDLATGNYIDPNRFYENDGDGTFTDRTVEYGVGHTGLCRSLHAADYDGDGWLDLFVVNLNGSDVLYRNLEGEGFQDVTVAAGVADAASLVSMGALFTDTDNDGDVDLYLTHDANQPNIHLRNNGNGTFSNTTAATGLGFVGNCMGVDAADINHDGWMDLYITNLYPSELFLNDGDGTFTPVAAAAGVNDSGMSWGCAFFDYDHDREWDLYVAKDYFFSPQPNILYRGEGDGTFAYVSADSPVLRHPFSDYGLAQADLDRDGDRDLIIATPGSGANPGIQILRNNASTGHAIALQLEGTASNRNAVGARVSVWAGGAVRNDEVHCGQGYSGASPFELHFGLGTAEVADSVRVRWPSGTVSMHYGLAADSVHSLVEPGADPWFYFGCTAQDACNYQPAAVFNDGSCTYVASGFDCDGEPLPGFPTEATHSIARLWNESLLHAIRHDRARPTVHARNLYHSSLLMHDLWAAFEPEGPQRPGTVLLGDTLHGFAVPFDGVGVDGGEIGRVEARRAAISYGMYRLLRHRFATAPRWPVIDVDLDARMASLGYDPAFTSTDVEAAGGDPTATGAALGNAFAAALIAYGLQDGSNEQIGYQNTFYNPVNWFLDMTQPGNPEMFFPNRWQPLQLSLFIDQSGNSYGSVTPEFLSAEWGHVDPFALDPATADLRERLGGIYPVYLDPGPPPALDENAWTEWDSDWKWGHALVATWSSHLDPSDGVVWDISPGALGGNGYIPEDAEAARAFYNLLDGGTTSAAGEGHPVNPSTGQPYAPELVLRGDFTRALAEFWADGPDSETPPGHWFKLFNDVTDQPACTRKWRGEGEPLDPLAWDVRGYLALGGAMHDVAIAAWALKGWYDTSRPVSALRWMADRGQSSDPEADSFHPAGIPLLPGYIELVTAADPPELTGLAGEHVGKVKVRTWRGPSAVIVPATDMAGVGWIRAENWWPYQRPTFVSPPFAGYVSGHSTYSRAAAEVLTLMTGDAFFPGGLAVYPMEAHEELVFEDGPSQSFDLQWATYRDAADQSALSRVWGGIHPPQDDWPGRRLGETIGVNAFLAAEALTLPLLGAPCAGAACPCPGDFNLDGARNLPDLLLVLLNYGLSAPADGSGAPPRLDLDGNGTVLAGDVLALLSLWAVPCP
jgi:hypothetical protein